MIPNAYKTVIDLAEEVHDDGTCTYSMASMSETGGISNAIFDFQVEIAVPNECERVFVAPFSAISGSLNNVSFTGKIKLIRD